jgi:cytidyltransferase-like protein
MTKVYTCLVGDLFHAGHVNFLRQAKELGDHLMVGVCSDEDCTRYKRVPIMTMSERMAVIETCRYVDSVIAAPPSVVDTAFMELHGIDLLVHADDSNEQQLMYFYGDAIRAGKFRTVPYTPGLSTTEILKRIAARPDPSSRWYFLTTEPSEQDNL